MGARDGSIARARRRIAADQRRVLADIDAARRAGGLSNREVGQVCGVDASTVWRILHGDIRAADVQVQACLAAAVGLDLRLRAYPAGDPIRDAGHSRLLERLRRDLEPSLRWRTEVPLAIEGDLRAWDAVIFGPGWRLMVEAETVIDDVQALERRIARKLRDDDVDHCLLLVADTPRNRRAVAVAPAGFAGWPLRTREVLVELRAGRRPAAGGIVFR